MLATSARNLVTSKLDSEVFCVLDQPVGHFDDFYSGQGQAKPQTQSRGQHLVGKHSDMLGIILKFRDVAISV